MYNKSLLSLLRKSSILLFFIILLVGSRSVQADPGPTIDDLKPDTGPVIEVTADDRAVRRDAPPWARVVPEIAIKPMEAEPAGDLLSAETGAFQLDSAQSSATIASDDFNSCGVDTNLWQFVDPIGDGSYSTNGTQLVIDVPSGTAHDVWYGGNNAPRLMQSVADDDFELEAKFESGMTAGYQLQGVIVEQNSGNYLRTDFYSDGSQTYLFVASFAGGNPSVIANVQVGGANLDPLYLRVGRVGNEFTVSYATDGTNWTNVATFTHAMTVNSVGPFAGNAGSAPAFTANIDYFFDTQAPIVPEDANSLDQTLTTATTGNGSVTVSPDQATYACNDPVELTPVADGGWRFSHWSGDASGSDEPLSLTMDGDKSVTAVFVEAQPATLTLTTVGDGSIEVEPDSPYYVGEEVTLTASAEIGSQFDGWSGDTSGTDQVITFVLTGDNEITATFEPDDAAPVLSNIQVSPTNAGATITFTTNEPTTSAVDYGTSTNYELGSVTSAEFKTDHVVVIGGLQSNTTYQYAITVTDGSDQTDTSGNLSFQTTQNGPYIDVWYGNNQSFGQLGNPQRWINIHGNVDSAEGIASLSYTLNGGSSRTLSVGPDSRRLAQAGDFNIDIDRADLNQGNNTVVISAEDGQGNISTEVVTVNYDAGNTWPLPYTADWSATNDVNSIAQVVDGHWGIDNGSLRPLVLDYDRLVAIGDESWTDYEVTVPMTLHSVDNSGFDYPSSGPGLGILMRWSGHTDNPIGNWQPKTGWQPHGAIGWYRWASPGQAQLQIAGSDGRSLDTTSLQAAPPVNTTYIFKMRVESVAGEGSIYSLKVWTSGQSEPAEWNLVGQAYASEPDSGSLLLLAHHVDVSFGNAVVTPVTNTTYTLDLTSSAGGSAEASPDLANYPEGTDVTLSATAEAGYVFAGWSGDASGSDNPIAITMDANKSVVATFDPDPTRYTVTSSVVGNGSVALDPDAADYGYGDEVTISAEADEGYIFTGWSGDLSGNDNPATLTMDGDKAVTATFAEDTRYVVTVNASGNGNVVVSPQQADYAPGDTVTISATPDAGWEFDGWSGEVQSSENPLTIVIDSDVALTATFTYDVMLPMITEVEVVPSATSAVVSWTTDEPATSRVDFGPTAAYELGFDESTALTTSHSVTLTGLDEATTYHFKITSADGNGNSAETADATFTTTNPNATGIISDDFSANSIDSAVWTFEDPVGDSSYTMTGESLTLSVPAGSSHDVWWGGNNSARMVQSVNDVDFEVEAKFESTVSQAYQLQGVLVKENNSNFLRFDFYSNGGSIFLYSASFNGGTPTARLQTELGTLPGPLWLRVTRAGDSWTLAYSTDGNNWTSGGSYSHNLAVSEVGVFAGNAGSSPAFTAEIDYFFSTADPIIPEDGGGNPATYTLTTNATTGGAVSASPDQATYDAGETVTLTATPDQGYLFTGWSGDLSGSDNPATVTMDGDKTITATFVEETATYTLTTNVTGSGSVAVSPDEPEYDAGDMVTLTATPAQGYVFTGWSGDLSGSDNPATVTMDGDKSITAEFAEDIRYTVSLNTSGSGAVAISPDQADYAPGDEVTITATPDAGWLFDGWSGSTTSSDNPLVLTVSDDVSLTATFTQDTTAPTVSNVAVNVGSDSAEITWSTDEPATSSVAYGETSGYGSGPVTNASPTTAHTAQLTGLIPGTTYHFEITVTDDFGNADSTADATFTTTDPSATGIDSDDFSAAALDTSIWSFEDPRGDSSYGLTGETLTLSVPAGTSHDIWWGGNNSARMVQSVNDVDFEIEAKFESTVSQAYQLQGLLVKETNSNFLRFDFYSNGGSIFLYSASFNGGAPTARLQTELGALPGPLWLRVTRSGDSWTLAYSTDGNNWTSGGSYSHSLAVSEVGVYAGNAGSSPAFTAEVDYFFSTADPIVPEDGNGGPAAYSLTTTTNGSGSVSANPDQAPYDAGETVTLTATAAQGYVFTGWSGDLSGSDNPATVTMDGDKLVTATFAEDTRHSISAEIDGNGSVSFSPQQADYGIGEVVTLTASADPSESFLGWGVDDPVTDAWWDSDWHYRLPLTASAAGFARTDYPVVADVDLTAVLNDFGTNSAVSLDSLRMVEIDANGSVLDANVPFQFDPSENFDAATNATGELVWLLTGTTNSAESRSYHLYFDLAGHAEPAAVVADQITVTDNVVDEGQASFQIETNQATYLFHKQGGGFSSLLDADGNDWINYNSSFGSAGTYRGLPNLVYPDNLFHPGTSSVTSELVNSGPLRSTIRSTSNNGNWVTVWEFYPDFARLTVEQAANDYWFLYEGTPGGELDAANDIVVRSDGSQGSVNTSWDGDLSGDEWVYFGDTADGRSLFLVNHENDSATDSYYQMENNMTVFGFGRSGLNRYLDAAPAEFTIGLIAGTDYASVSQQIPGLYKPSSVVVGAGETIGNGDGTLMVTVMADVAVTASFTATAAASAETTTTVQHEIALPVAAIPTSAEWLTQIS